MTPVDQTCFNAVAPGDPLPPIGDRGNCMQAAVASILNLTLDDVPNFIDHARDDDHELPEDVPPAWFESLLGFLVSRGYSLVVTTVPLPGLGLMSGRSPRGPWTHLVVAEGPDVVHDPHPDRTGVTEPDSWWYLVPLDPTCLVAS